MRYLIVLRGGLRLLLLLGGLVLLAPSWFLTVSWHEESSMLQLLRPFSGPIIAAEAELARAILAMLILAIGIGFLAVVLNLRRERETLDGTSRFSGWFSFLFVLVGIACLEPYPLYLEPGVKPSFDIARNLFVSLPTILRTAGLLAVLYGIGSQRRRFLADAFRWFLARLTLLKPTMSMVIVGFAGTTMALLIGGIGFSRLPSLRDEVATLFQAGIFASGAMTLEPPPWVDFMDVSCIITSPAWASMYPPGWAGVLALGKVFGSTWLIVVMLAGLCTAAVFSLLLREAGTEAAWIGSLLLLSSPFFLRLSGSYMTHVGALLFIVLFLSIVLDPSKCQRAGWGAVAGFCLAVAASMRPLPAIAMAIPAVGLLLKRFLDDGRRMLRFMALFVVATAVVLSIWMIYNVATTGAWHTSGYQARLGEIAAMGFGERIMGEHTLVLGVFHDLGRFFRLCEQGFGLPFAVALLIGLGLYLMRWNAHRRVLFIGFVLVWLTSGLYWWYEHWFGPRYLFEGLPGVLLVISIGLAKLMKAPRIGEWVRAGLLIGFVWAFVALLPDELVKLRQGYGEVDRHSVHQLRAPHLAGTAVMIEDSDMNVWPHDTYISAFLAMVLDDFQGAMMVRDMGEMNEALKGLIPATEWYYYRHGDRTGEGYLERIEAPPVP